MFISPAKIDWKEFTSNVGANCDTWTKSFSEGTDDFEDLEEDLHNINCWTQVLMELRRDHAVLGFHIN